MSRARSKRTPAEIAVVGAPRTPWTDLYHELLRAPWWLDILALAALFLLINLAFGFGSRAGGRGGGGGPASLADHFFLNVQTRGTIGYGVLYPQSEAAQALVTTEAIVGVSLAALRHAT